MGPYTQYNTILGTYPPTPPFELAWTSLQPNPGWVQESGHLVECLGARGAEFLQRRQVERALADDEAQHIREGRQQHLEQRKIGFERDQTIITSARRMGGARCETERMLHGGAKI